MINRVLKMLLLAVALSAAFGARREAEAHHGCRHHGPVGHGVVETGPVYGFGAVRYRSSWHSHNYRPRTFYHQGYYGNFSQYSVGWGF